MVAATRGAGPRSEAQKGAKAAPKRAPLKVVAPEERSRTLSAVGSMVAGFFFVVLMGLAALHAVVVQAQAELDRVNADIAELEDTRTLSMAERARAQSVVGLAPTALEAGYVPAAELVILTTVPTGRLSAPTTDDPFAAEGLG